MPPPLDNQLIRQVASTYNLPEDLLRGQILQESGGDPNAYRYEIDFFHRYILDNPEAKAKQYGPLAACSYGLLQVMLEVAYEIGFVGRPEELFVPRVGLAWGAKKMRALWDWAGGTGSDYPRALSAYNIGPGRAMGPPFLNQKYVDGVLRFSRRA